jgi:tetrahydromethanopterin S-methyltransferase subunit F
MEGLGQTIEIEKTSDRAERIRVAERGVAEMFNANMEASDMIVNRIRENPSFEGREERGF